MNESSTKKPWARDVRLFLVLIPLINALNYYLTYSHPGFDWKTLVTYFVDTLEGYAAWWGIRSMIHWLNHRLPFDAGSLKRITTQLLLTSVVGLSIIIAATEALNALFGPGPLPASFYRFTIFIFLIWILAINGIYIGWHFYDVAHHVRQAWQAEKVKQETGFAVRNGKQRRLLPYAEIVGFYADGDYTAVVTTGPKKYLSDFSLDAIERNLPDGFFRLSRQFLLSRAAVQGYTPAEHGKLVALLKAPDHLPASVPVSRLKAAAFKAWLLPA